MNNYEEIRKTIDDLLKDTNIPESQQSIVAEYISNEILRKIDFYTRKFYIIVTKDDRFIRYATDSSGSKNVFIGMAASSATVFDDIVSCNEVLEKCKRKYPSEVFMVESFYL